jgi:hypothetical protein
MKVCSLLALISLLGVSLFAADINGKWTATMQMGQGKGGQKGGQQKGGPMEVTYEFKAEGGNITTCTATNPRGTQPLADCKLEGDQISFSQTFSRGDQPTKILYKGTVSGDEIKFTATREGGQQGREFTAKRAQ